MYSSCLQSVPNSELETKLDDSDALRKEAAVLQPNKTWTQKKYLANIGSAPCKKNTIVQNRNI